jgi:hypothetical protein
MKPSYFHPDISGIVGIFVELVVVGSAIANIGLNIVKTTVSTTTPKMLEMMNFGFLIVCVFVIE